MSTTRLRRSDRCAHPSRPRILEIRLAPAVAERSAAVAGNFTAWVPVEMARATDGSFLLRVAVPPTTDFQCKVLVDDERWTVEAVTAVDVNPTRHTTASIAERTARRTVVRASPSPARRQPPHNGILG